MERLEYFGHYFFGLHIMSLFLMAVFVRIIPLALGLVLFSVITAVASGALFTEAQYVQRRSGHS